MNSPKEFILTFCGALTDSVNVYWTLIKPLKALQGSFEPREQINVSK